MTISFTMAPDVSHEKGPPEGAGQDVGAQLRPMLAGAHARGMADVLDLLGMSAALIDAAGMVLHLNAGAKRLVGRDISMVHAHLMLKDDSENRALLAMIGAALGETPRAGEMMIHGAHGGIRLQALPVTANARDGCQLLKALVLMIPLGDSATRA
ncbi:MAG: hypothetical protein KGQ46_10885 [Hyphomicrobiales bacterium]|nr:hypothetical protein [Hyphomicrobiales bacterium]MDE2113250.1 hypothetical protein [Hyphomicrobiales bacterium]